MSLLDSMMEKCVMLDKVSTQDGLGGFFSTWKEGAEFDAVIIKTSSPEVLTAEINGAKEQYSVVVKSSVTLDYHDVFRRISDEAVFRVTGYTHDNEAPAASTVQITKVTAERWEIPA